jgi:hypothetical protein
MVIGRDGKGCASALPANPEIAATAIVAKTSLRIGKVRSLSGLAEPGAESIRMWNH